MSRIRWMPLAGLVLGATLTFGACGGDDKKDDGGTAKTPATERTASGDADPTKTSDGGTASGDLKELQKLAEKFAESTFQAVYTVAGGEAGSPLQDGTITIYKDGPNKLRFDIKAEQDGEVFEGAFIQSDTGSYFCIVGGEFGALLGDEAGDGICTKSDPQDPSNPVASLADEFGDLDIGNVEIKSKEDRKIAGQDGTCYVVFDKDVNETTTTCFNDDGVLLAIESQAADGLSFEATSVEGDVSDSDFEPPYPVQEIPGLGQ